MSQVILGVDPGIRHTGWCLLIDGKPADNGVIMPTGEGRLLVAEAIRESLAGIAEVVDGIDIAAAGVEEVQWYGSRKRITLPLSHVAGSIMGYLAACGISVYPLLATQRRGIKIPKTWLRKLPSEHERDACELAIVVRKHLAALDAGVSSDHRSVSAVARRKITVAKNAHGKD